MRKMSTSRGPYTACITACCLGLVLSLAGCSGDEHAPAVTGPAIATIPPAPLELPPTGRLPGNAHPLAYRLHLTIIPEQAGFSGKAEIDIALDRETNHLWLHGRDLDVASVTVNGAGDVSASYRQEEPIGVALVQFDHPVGPGDITLAFDYTAPFNTNLEGLYKVTADGRDYAYTQFEPTSARLAFPGFDEPGYKVPFDITLTVSADDVAIGNTPVVEETAEDGGRKTLRFATTRPLPTYLVAMAVGRFDVVEWEPIPASGLRGQPVPLRGITTAGKGAQIRFALSHTPEILLALEDYFDTPYPFPKLDLIAIPDFSFGAMENAGAITYREQLMLMDSAASIAQQRNYFYVNAHEISHQWFGDLVTPVWWTDIWLNEAFATWMSYTVLNRLYPAQGYRSNLLERAYDAMNIDALASTRQVREPVERHVDIINSFDGITYRKGGGVLTMFEDYLGAENFQRGIRRYMKQYAFGNTAAEDFIGAIAEANPDAGNIEAAFLSFLEQPGVPLLSVSQQCGTGRPVVTLAQGRYTPLGSHTRPGQQWRIPVCLAYGRDQQREQYCTLMEQADARVTLPVEYCPDYLAPNSGGGSYYRYSLPAADWRALVDHVDQLDPNEQIALAGNLGAAWHSGAVDTRNYVDLLPGVAGKTYWRAAIAPFDDLALMLDEFLDGAALEKARQRLGAIYRARLDAIGMAGGDEETALFRAALARFLALEVHEGDIRAQLLDAGRQAVGYGDDDQLHLDQVDANLRGITFRVAIEEAGAPYADLLWHHLAGSGDAQLRSELLGALGWSRDPGVAARSRNTILSESIRDNEIYYLIDAQMRHRETRDDMWRWIREHYDALLDRLPAHNRGLTPNLVAGYCDSGKRDEVEAFFASRVEDLEGGPRSLAQTLESIELCAALKAHHAGDAVALFRTE